MNACNSELLDCLRGKKPKFCYTLLKKKDYNSLIFEGVKKKKKGKNKTLGLDVRAAWSTGVADSPGINTYRNRGDLTMVNTC